MTKNIIIISSSPRKGGNSDKLCDEFIKGAKETGKKTEKIFLKDYKINHCLGCMKCQETGSCIQKDDMGKILEKIEKAEVLVLATPVYFDTISGQLKTFIDRTCSRYQNLKNLDIYTIFTAAESFEVTLDEIKNFTKFLPNSTMKEEIKGIATFIGEIENSTETMEKAFNAGKNC